MKMLNKKGQSKGFTLIEVLIVVIIVAILAALIVPRMLTQPEKAVIAEAQQHLGTLIRAQQAYMDATNTSAFLTITAGSATNWDRLGLVYPTSTKFQYTCTGTQCTASRTNSSQFSGRSIQLANNGFYTCGGVGANLYVNVLATNNDRGCTI